jgi:hypothetical protein
MRGIWRALLPAPVLTGSNARALFAAAASLFILFAGAAQATTPTIAPVSGYWWNPSQTGNGFVIEIQNNQLFMAGFLYAASGEATWVATLGPMSSSSAYAGTLFTDSGGQTLTGAYQGAPRSTTTLGPISITFITDTKATIVWPGGTENIQRFDIIPGGSTATQAATNPQTGWWFNANESGRGFGIEVQNGNIWIAGYMYDASGNPIWYLATGTLADGVYTGQWTQYQGGLTLTGSYKAPTVANPAVGPITAQFSSPSAGTLTLPDGRQIPLTRFVIPGGPSGPTLTAFTPAEGLPATLLTITGTNINPGATLSLTLSDSTGYNVNIPLTAATSTSITASVPPYINTSNGSFGSGVVNLTLTQSSGGATQNSNTLTTGYQIQNLTTPKTSGNGTLALIQANLQEANKLQQKIAGTAQDTPAVQSAIATQITDLQTLATNIQNVVQNGQSISLGSIGGVDITVTPANINDVDTLIIDTLSSLATPQTAASSMRAETTAPAGCMSAEAQAFSNGILAGDNATTLQALALAMIEAPYASTACGDAAAFTLAYDIFGGAGSFAIGLSNAAGNNADSSLLPAAALFAATNTNASAAVGLNAILSVVLAAEAATVESAISGVQGLSQPAINQLVSEATGVLLAEINDSQAFINVVAPPGSSTIPGNITQGDYTIYLAICSTVGSSQDCPAQSQLTTFTNTNATALANFLSTEFSAECSAENQIPNISCSATYSSFNGTQFTYTVNIAGGTAQLPQTVVITFTLVKTG